MFGSNKSSNKWKTLLLLAKKSRLEETQCNNNNNNNKIENQFVCKLWKHYSSFSILYKFGIWIWHFSFYHLFMHTFYQNIVVSRWYRPSFYTILSESIRFFVLITTTQQTHIHFIVSSVISYSISTFYFITVSIFYTMCVYV